MCTSGFVCLVLVYLGKGCMVSAAGIELGSCCVVFGLELGCFCLHFARITRISHLAWPRKLQQHFSVLNTQSSEGNIFQSVKDSDVHCLTWSQTWFCCCFKVHENLMDRIVKLSLSRACLTWLGPRFSLPSHTAAPWPFLALLCRCLLHFLQHWSSLSGFPGSLTPLIFRTASFEECSLG